MEAAISLFLVLIGLVFGSEIDPDQRAMYPNCGTGVPLKDVLSLCVV